MPSWKFSSAAFYGTPDAIHKLIKIGLENSKLQSTGDLRQDFDLLVAEGKHLEADEKTHQVVSVKGLTARTFLPMPETFLLFDTTNHPDQYPDAAKEQKEKYGAVGWYDYNCLTLGTKWDFDLQEVILEEVAGWCELSFDIQTAWDYPDQWFIAINKLVPELIVSFTVLGYYEPADILDCSGEYDLCGYVEDGVIKEGLSAPGIEIWRYIIEEDYRDRNDTLDAKVIVLPNDSDDNHPVVQEMLSKGFEIVDRDPISNVQRYNTGMYFCFLKKKKKIFIDMDNVLVDFQSGLNQVSEEVKAKYYADDGKGKPHYDDIPGLFSLMEPMPGAIEAVHRLAEKYDCYILTTAPWENPSAWSDKLLWVKKYIGDVFYKRLIISHHKNLCHGDYLIDDRGSNGTSEFDGEWIQFGSTEYPDWESVVDYLLT